MRAARAKICGAREHVGGLGSVSLELLQLRHARLEVLAAEVAFDKPLGDRDRDVVRLERPVSRIQPFALAKVVALPALAKHERPLRQIEQLLFQLGLDQRALLLDHEDQLEPFGELHDPTRLERPCHSHFVDADPQRVRLDLVDPQCVHRRASVEIALARRHDADARSGPATRHDAIEFVCASERGDRATLVVMKAPLLVERRIAEPDIQATRRHRVVIFGRKNDVYPIRVAVDGRRGLDIVLHALQANPHARIPRHAIAQQAVVEQLLHPGGIEDGDHRIHHRELGLMRAGRAFAGVVIAEQRQDTAVLRGACVIGVAKCIAGTVDARPLAVPQREYAIVLALAAKLRLLRAPHCRRSEVFVETGMEHDIVLLDQLLCALECIFQRSDRRTAIAADVTSGVEPGSLVPRLLHQHQANDRLGARQQLPSDPKIEFLIQRMHALGHWSSPRTFAGTKPAMWPSQGTERIIPRIWCRTRPATRIEYRHGVSAVRALHARKRIDFPKL